MSEDFRSFCSTDNIYDVLASFSPIDLNLNLSDRYVFDVDDIADGFLQSFNSMPPGILAHELAHAFHTATPAGLLDLMNYFVSEHLAREVIVEAAEIRSVVPPGGIAASTDLNNRNSDLWYAYRKALHFNTQLAFGQGGLLFSRDTLSNSSLDLSGYQFADSSELPPNHVELLGAKHVYEGFGAIFEALNGDIPSVMSSLPVLPYLACFTRYQNAVQESGIQGSLHEFAAILDTALMMEIDWLLLRSTAGNPLDNFTTLLSVLQTFGSERRLGPISLPDRQLQLGNFQNELLSEVRSDYATLEEICALILDRLPSLNEEFKYYTAWPAPWSIDRYIEFIEVAVRYRIEKLECACPVDALHAPRLELVRMAMVTLPMTVSFGPIIWNYEQSQKNHETHMAFVDFAFGSFKHVLDEIVYGQRPCVHRRLCALSVRPACSGLTRTLKSADSHCPREYAIRMVMSALGLGLSETS